MVDLSSFISLLTLSVLGVIGWFIYKVYIWPYYISSLRKIPGPASNSLFYGNLKTILEEEVNIVHILIDSLTLILLFLLFGDPQFRRWIKEYGNIVKFYGMLNQPVV